MVRGTKHVNGALCGPWRQAPGHHGITVSWHHYAPGEIVSLYLRRVEAYDAITLRRDEAYDAITP